MPLDFYDSISFMYRPLDFPLVLLPGIFLVGAIIGSWLNVCILRLPLEKSIVWPDSHCMSCLHPIRWRDNLPIVSYWLLGGKCRHCGARFSRRYMLIELGVACGFCLLWWYYLVWLPESAGTGVLQINPYKNVPKLALAGWWLASVIFLCFLVVATFTDLDHREIPLRLTIPGTILGIILGTIYPWPFPLKPMVPADAILGGMNISEGAIFLLPQGVQPWPFAVVDIPWLAPGTPGLGFVTAVLGALAGTGLIRGLRFLFSWGFRKEAMGLGDADLLMMIGAFLGWQSILFVLLYAIVLGVIFIILGVLYFVLFNQPMMRDLAFGPYLAGGAVVTLYGPIPSYVVGQRLLFDVPLILLFLVVGVVLTVSICYVWRVAAVVRRAW